MTECEAKRNDLLKLKAERCCVSGNHVGAAVALSSWVQARGHAAQGTQACRDCTVWPVLPALYGQPCIINGQPARPLILCSTVTRLTSFLSKLDITRRVRAHHYQRQATLLLAGQDALRSPLPKLSCSALLSTRPVVPRGTQRGSSDLRRALCVLPVIT